MYVTLVEALYAENQINRIKVDVKKVEEWVGLYKTDQEGKTHEVVGCSKNFTGQGCQKEFRI